MANKFKIKKGANIQPVAGSTVTEEGDIAYNDTSNQLEVFGAAAAEPITTTTNTQTLSAKSIDADTNTLTNIANAAIKAAAAIALNKLAATTVSRALVSDGSGFVAAATTTAAEIEFVNGVTSAIQTQINTKAPSASPTFTGTVTTPVTASRALVTGASNELAVATTTAAEIEFVNGVTSAIQTQLDGKASAATSQTASYDIKNLGIACSVAASALTIALKQADGSTDPGATTAAVNIAFRDTTITNGNYSVVSATAATSLVISSGSTLGHIDAVESDIFVYAVNNAGTITLAASSTLYPDSNVTTTTAEGGVGGADSATLIYSTAAHTSKAIRLIARLKSTQTTAGTWAAVPTEVALTGTFRPLKSPTIQKFTSGSGTYTLPLTPKPLYIKVKLCGGGGGGGPGTSSTAAGGTGGNTTFGTSLLQANGGVGGAITGNGGDGGTASLGTGPIGTAIQGGKGGGQGYNAAASQYIPAGMGGMTPYFGGAGPIPTSNGVGLNGITNTGGGGSGGSSNATATNTSGSGGGSGGFIDAIILSLLTSYSYTVGAAGTAGTGGSAGGAGGSGYIEVTEFYQ